MTEEQRNNYMKRLEHEYEDFRREMYTKPSAEVFDNSETVLNMKYAYDCLRDESLSPKYLEYVMLARFPLHEIAKTQEAMDAVTYFDNPLKATITEICEKSLFDGDYTEAYSARIPIAFHRKVSSISEISEMSRLAADDKYLIEKIIVLKPSEFESFANDLLQDQAFIMRNKDLMRFDGQNECWRCLLVRDAGTDRGVLVESDGYDYARYAAYVENTRELDLKDVPNEDLSKPKGRKRTLANQHRSHER